MCEEYGYQRSGKKCREKFENLYKYYKKTKEGKAGRQDNGKHYRFFRQLEALYGEHHPPSTSAATFPPQPTTNTSHHRQSALIVQPLRGYDSKSLSNSSSFDNLSSDDNLNESMESNGSIKKSAKRRWKTEIKEFIDLKMRKIMEKQDTLLENVIKTFESRENERMVRREEWRKQEVDRVEREHKFRVSERAWIEARDLALISSLEKLCNNNNGSNQWLEHETTRLVQVRKSMESRFQQCGFLEEGLWEDIATKMSYLGNHRSAIVCKEKWDCLNKDDFQENGIIKDEGKKKRKENYEGVNYVNDYHSNDIHNNNNEGEIYMNQLSGFSNCEINEPSLQLNEGSSSSPFFHHSNVNVNMIDGAGIVMRDSSLRFLIP